jgi:hypothetical protein
MAIRQACRLKGRGSLAFRNQSKLNLCVSLNYFFVHIETGDGWRGVQELRDFLAQSHLSDQNLNAFLHRQGRVKETKIDRSSIQSGGGAIGRFHGHGSG